MRILSHFAADDSWYSSVLPYTNNENNVHWMSQSKILRQNSNACQHPDPTMCRSPALGPGLLSILSFLSCTHEQSFQKQLQWLWDKCSTCFNSGHGKASGITILVLKNRQLMSTNVIFNETGCSGYIPHFLCFSVHKLWFPVKSVRTDEAVSLKVAIFGQPLFLQWFVAEMFQKVFLHMWYTMTLIQCLTRTLPFCQWDQQHLFFIIWFRYSATFKQESPAIADKPARRESLPKIAPIRRAYNVVADNTGLSSFV